MRRNTAFITLCTTIGMVFSPFAEMSFAAEIDKNLWEKFLKYDLLIADYDTLTAKEQSLCRFIFETEQSSDITIRCERARRTLARDENIGERLTLEQLENCYGIWDRYAETKDGMPWYQHCVPDIQYLDGWEKCDEYWLDEQGLSKAVYTNINTGADESTLKITLCGVSDLSGYDLSTVKVEQLDDGTYQVEYEQAVKPAPYNPSGLTTSDRVLQQDGFTYYIMDDGTAALLRTPYTGAEYNAEAIETTVVIPDSINDDPITVIAEGAFILAPVTEIVLPDSITMIDPIAFRDCKYLRTVNIPNNLEYLGWNAFGNCTALQKIEMDSPMLRISSAAFMNCGITEAVINVKEIGESAFEGCEDLRTVQLGEHLTGISAKAFSDCDRLMACQLPDALRWIGVGAFSDSITAFTVPATVALIGALPRQQGEGATSTVSPPPATHPLTDAQPCAFPDGAMIYGYTDSPVQAYAEENKLQFLPLDVISLMGDLNGDQQQSVADLVMLQKWLMGEDVGFSVWYAADYDRNAVLNAVDLSMMKRELIAGNTH